MGKAKDKASILYGTGTHRASHGDQDIDYVLDAMNLNEARQRYREQFGVNVDDRSIDAEIRNVFKDRQSYEFPPLNVEIPAHVVLALLLRKGATGTTSGPKAQPPGVRLRNYRALIWARDQMKNGEKLDDVAKATAKKCSLSEAEICNRLRHPTRFGLTKYDKV